MVPAFSGLGAPYWEQHAKGCLFGMTRGTTKSHVARAALESIAFQTMDVLKAMEAGARMPIRELRVDGGASANKLLMQFQSDILNVKVSRPRITETTALGAAYLAGLAVGFWSSADQIQRQWQLDKEFIPSMESSLRDRKQQEWKRAVDALIYWSRS
jgi:glycerol kinase